MYSRASCKQHIGSMCEYSWGNLAIPPNKVTDFLKAWSEFSSASRSCLNHALFSANVISSCPCFHHQLIATFHFSGASAIWHAGEAFLQSHMSTINALVILVAGTSKHCPFDCTKLPHFDGNLPSLAVLSNHVLNYLNKTAIKPQDVKNNICTF